MKIEAGFEKMLWGSRLIVLVAIMASLVCGFGMFAMATVDTIKFTHKVLIYFSQHEDKELEDIRNTLVTGCVEVIDGYLLATMMLIFGFGLYELFISRIDAAENSKSASKILVIQNLDDLKDRLSKLVLLILIVKYFQNTLSNASSAIDLLYFALGIFLIGVSLYFSHKKDNHT